MTKLTDNQRVILDKLQSCTWAHLYKLEEQKDIAILIRRGYIFKKTKLNRNYFKLALDKQ